MPTTVVASGAANRARRESIAAPPLRVVIRVFLQLRLLGPHPNSNSATGLFPLLSAPQTEIVLPSTQIPAQLRNQESPGKIPLISLRRFRTNDYDGSNQTLS